MNCAAIMTSTDQNEVHSSISEAIKANHEQLMERLEMWLADVEFKIQSMKLGNQLDRLHDDRTAAMEAIASIQAPPSTTSPTADAVATEARILSPSGSPSVEPEEEQRTSRRVSENSYDLAKKEASKVEIHKHLHSMTMYSEKKRTWCDRWCPCWRDLQKNVRPIVKSAKFEIFFACILVANSLYIGAQLQYMSISQDASFQPTFVGFHIAFAVLFTTECALMFVGLGIRKYLFSAEWVWGWLDVLVVVSAWTELVFDLTNFTSGGSNAGVRILKVFKFTRLLQGLRSLRIIRFIGGLRVLVYSMFDATRSLAWALFLGALVVYVFALIFSNAAIDHLLSQEEHVTLQRHWGTMDLAVTTLYRSILGGLDWGEAADALLPLGIFWVQVFHFYVGFVCLLLLNVMTGVFCNSAIRAAEHDHDIMMQNRHRFRAMATNLFQKMDSTGYGSITISEFEKLFEDEDMQAFLDSIEITASDAWTLFASLDIDRDKVISVEEFTEGCLKLHGNARSVDLYALRQQNLKMRTYMEKMAQTQKRIAEALPLILQGMPGKTILSV